jgi:hypothetical protein
MKATMPELSKTIPIFQDMSCRGLTLASGFAGGMTAEKHGKLIGAAKATATRDLTDLLKQGALLSKSPI